MELLEGIESRRSFRAFKSTPIPEEILKRVLKAANRSPSYRNTQPWEVAVVSGKKRDELSRIIFDLAKKETAGNPDIPDAVHWLPQNRARFTELQDRRFAAVGRDPANAEDRKYMRLLNFEFYGAPCSIFLFIDKVLDTWAIFDLGLFAESLILAAHSFGLGSVIQGSTIAYPDTVRDFLGIPKNKRLILGISIGYPDMKAKINQYDTSRADLDEFVKWFK